MFNFVTFRRFIVRHLGTILSVLLGVLIAGSIELILWHCGLLSFP